MQFKNTPPPPPPKQKGNRTASLHETINLFKKWTIVRPSCFSPKADHFAHGFKTKKKKEYI